jgi:predicted alternative tryptophan synthase beta-subunit
MLSEHLIVPSMEKLLADGTITEYEIDEPAIHTSAPGMFFVVYVAPKPEGIDAVQAAIVAAGKAHVLGIEAFTAIVDFTGHRDELMKGSGTFK